MINKEGISFLNQMIKSLEEAELKLEEAYERKDYEKLNQAKRFMIEIQGKISEALK